MSWWLFDVVPLKLMMSCFLSLHKVINYYSQRVNNRKQFLVTYILNCCSAQAITGFNTAACTQAQETDEDKASHIKDKVICRLIIGNSFVTQKCQYNKVCEKRYGGLWEQDKRKMRVCPKIQIIYLCLY